MLTPDEALGLISAIDDSHRDGHITPERHDDLIRAAQRESNQVTATNRVSIQQCLKCDLKTTHGAWPDSGQQGFEFAERQSLMWAEIAQQRLAELPTKPTEYNVSGASSSFVEHLARSQRELHKKTSVKLRIVVETPRRMGISLLSVLGGERALERMYHALGNTTPMPTEFEPYDGIVIRERS